MAESFTGVLVSLAGLVIKSPNYIKWHTQLLIRFGY